MQSNIEVTINDRDWPNLDLVIKIGPRVEVLKTRFDKAEVQFSSTISKFVKEAVDTAKLRRQ